MKPSKSLISWTLIAFACAIVPALASDARHTVRTLETVNCKSSNPCISGGNAGSGPGVAGASASGNGVEGSTSFSGSGSSNAYGVAGIANSSGTSNAGVFGYSTSGDGVSAYSSTLNGVYGNTSSGTGVFGNATSGVAVYGSSGGTLGGVFGNATNVDGVGIDGGNSSIGGTAIVGVASGTNGNAIGAAGVLNDDAASGTGLLGIVTSASNNAATAVVGTTGSPNGGTGELGAGTGEGVVAIGAAAAGSAKDPALDVASGSGADSVGVFNSAGSKALETFEVQATTQDTKLCKNLKPPCAAGGDVYITGDVHVKGTLTSKDAPATYVPRTRGAGAVAYYGTAARTARLEDDGEAQLQLGRADVSLKPDFAATIDTRVPYLVFVTPEGDQAMFVSRRSSAGFTVRAIGGSRSNVPFAYRVVADAASPTEDVGGFREVRQTFADPKRHFRHVARLIAQREAVLSRKYRP
ncbi:MAG TPA: hypothetical protein VKR56_15460 [Candidatus Cybelea sp.]|jgi:hypothetical protein|nr:hypothetical protein [Candidatus Cybelea sp.]